MNRQQGMRLYRTEMGDYFIYHPLLSHMLTEIYRCQRVGYPLRTRDRGIRQPYPYLKTYKTTHAMREPSSRNDVFGTLYSP